MYGSATTGYVNDVPVRLNRKFYPLPKCDQAWDSAVDVPIRCPVDILNEEYDFSSEKKAIKDFQTNLQKYTTKVHAKIQPELESEIVSSGYSSSSWSSWSSITDTPSIDTQKVPHIDQRQLSATLSSLRTISCNDILQPTIAKYPAVNSSNQQMMPILKLEDFESVTSSPFDMMELKSMNDIEELRRLWTHQSNDYVS